MRLWRGRSAGPVPNLPPADPYAGEQLVQRACAEHQRAHGEPGPDPVDGRCHGIVTLYGKVPASEHEAVMFTIHRVPGVRAVVDHLDGPASPTNNAEASPIESASRTCRCLPEEPAGLWSAVPPREMPRRAGGFDVSKTGSNHPAERARIGFGRSNGPDAS